MNLIIRNSEAIGGGNVDIKVLESEGGFIHSHDFFRKVLAVRKVTRRRAGGIPHKGGGQVGRWRHAEALRKVGYRVSLLALFACLDAVGWVG